MNKNKNEEENEMKMKGTNEQVTSELEMKEQEG